ncbi:DNA-directed RNA polymerase subunit delta [Peribacillus alkalitolerans]|uniref:DNA-directed RNA polymerase subunit delta n=1 Tax=Peribacillus alkalitolerans TaxID=1550385 RepID=UPI0013CF983E|nr:DNA-directed RNA polymerase subunit delta [Peribacillus alkalitolerans]
MSLSQYSKEDLLEMSMLEAAYELLVEKKQAVSFKELVDEIKAIQELSDEELKQRLSQFYTDLNIDGRFSCIGDNRWGLKSWYPVDQIEDEIVHTTTKPKKKKAKKAVDEDEIDDFDEIEEDELDGFDDLDDYEEELDEDEEEDEVELIEDLDEDEDLDDDSLIEEDELLIEEDDSDLEEDEEEEEFEEDEEL